MKGASTIHSLIQSCLILLGFTLISQVSASTARAVAISNFKDCLSGRVPLTLPSSPAFAALARRSYRNSHTTPLAVVVATTEAHVQDAVSCAARHGLKVCARSGGHSLIGGSMCAGVLIDLGKMRTVRQDREIAYLDAGATLGDALYGLWKNDKRRWFASGVCPGVGVGGYVLGGGHGPYEGTLGMACDSVLAMRVVDHGGRLLRASRDQHSDLFWGLCGSGGGQLGVVTRFVVRTVPSHPYDRGVVFRFKWTEHKRAGELLSKWQDYDEDGGKTWFRMEMYRGSAEVGVTGYGACYDVAGVEECLARLQKAAFFNVPSRKTEFIAKAGNALRLHAFFSGDGGWGRKFANDTKKAMLEARDTDIGSANDRLFRSSMLSFGGMRKAPTASDWQKYADFCRDPGRESIPWHVCELNLFNNAIDKPQPNAFPHRGAKVITHYIIGGGKEEDRLFVYGRMKNLLLKWTSGVYVNYGELQLGKAEYPRMYWGQSLGRLKLVKKKYDPNGLFANPQPIPV